MRPNHHTLDRNQVHRLAAQHLQAHLGRQSRAARKSWPATELAGHRTDHGGQS